jgi:hypothetical protein
MPHLFIVAREEPGLFGYLAREFADETDVIVILDRRRGQERRSNGAGSPRALPPDGTERRRSDRRRDGEVVQALRTLGYAIVQVG